MNPNPTLNEPHNDIHEILMAMLGCLRSHEIMLHLYSLIWYKNYVRSTDIVSGCFVVIQA